MAIHWVRIIESGHQSTQRLFELGQSFGVCKRMRRWPSLYTINEFLRMGRDDGKLGTDVEWEACELSMDDYEKAVLAFMAGAPFELSTDAVAWDTWFAGLDAERAV
jgi:hypothetical protein